MKKFAFVLGLCLLWAANLPAQTFEAKVNRAEVPEGETFLLSVELEGAKTNSTPDFSVLNRDFTVYSVSNAYRTNIINGQVSQSQQWNLVLMPNKSGKLTIPAISLDNYQTAPLQINVGAVSQTAPAQTAAPNRPRFKIEAEADNRSPYVQQQVNYTLTLYDTGGLQGEEPVFNPIMKMTGLSKALAHRKSTRKPLTGETYAKSSFAMRCFRKKAVFRKFPPCVLTAIT